MKRKRQYQPAIMPYVGDRIEGVVVSAQRAKWKAKHAAPTDEMIRMTRFVWMRQPFLWDDRHKLHARVLGACMRAGLIWPEKTGKGETLKAADYRRLER